MIWCISISLQEGRETEREGGTAKGMGQSLLGYLIDAFYRTLGSAWVVSCKNTVK